MNFDLFLDPYSVKGLKLRAEKLRQSPYRLILEMAAEQLENKKINKYEVKKIIEFSRSGKTELLNVAMKMLNLNHNQTQVALKILDGLK